MIVMTTLRTFRQKQNIAYHYRLLHECRKQVFKIHIIDNYSNSYHIMTDCQPVLMTVPVECRWIGYGSTLQSYTGATRRKSQLTVPLFRVCSYYAKHLQTFLTWTSIWTQASAFSIRVARSLSLYCFNIFRQFRNTRPSLSHSIFQSMCIICMHVSIYV